MAWCANWPSMINIWGRALVKVVYLSELRKFSVVQDRRPSATGANASHKPNVGNMFSSGSRGHILASTSKRFFDVDHVLGEAINATFNAIDCHLVIVEAHGQR